MAFHQTQQVLISNSLKPRHHHHHHHLILTWRVLLFLFHLPYLTNAQSFDLTYYIDEQIPQSTVVGSIANDSEIDDLLSSSDFQSLSYRLLNYPDTNAFNLFTIASNSGILRTAKPIDREILCRFKSKCLLHLHVAAQTASGQQFYTFSVRIFVRDINDNSPVFHLTSAYVEIDETASIDTSLPIPSATDTDILNNTLQSYRLLTKSDVFGLKVSRNLDGTLVPQLYLKSELDREKQDSYILTVVAVDGGSPRRTGELTVNVTVKDANDNAPIFSQQTYDLVINEVTPVNTKIMTLKAFDPDIGDNGHVLYRLGIRQFQESLELFKVTPDTGYIITERELTSFQGQSMRLVVEAVDRGRKPLIAQAEVNIHIRDSVNNVPQIRMTTTNSNLIFHITEEAKPGFVVTHFVVEDNDSGENGIVRCYLNNPVFGLQGLKAKEYKVSVSQDLDREDTPFYDVSVTCEDGGHPPLSAHIRFAVILTDANDKTPKFRQGEYRVHVPENEKNYPVVTVRATDEDQGNNAKVTYSLGNVTSLVNSYIEINPVSGEIKTRKGLDRELFPRLQFDVVATDGGKKPLSSTTTVIIDVDDKNDNTPSVPSGYYLGVMENQPPGTAVGRIRAIDPDLGPAGRVGYRLLSDNGATRLFNLTVNGLLKTLQPFDRETNDTYQISVVAVDSGIQPRSNALRIKVIITDDNDNAPEFVFPRSRNKTAYVGVDIKSNTTVTRIVATDRDYGENATIQYSFEVGRQNLFRVDSRSGRVFTRRNVKHSDKGSYNIRVFIRDMGPEPITKYSDLLLIVTPGNGTGTAAASNVYPKSHIIIVAILIGITIIIAVLVFVVVFRFITKDRNRNNMRHAKYTGGLPMAVKSRSTSPHDDNSSEEGPWRRYDEAKRQTPSGGGGPAIRSTDVNYDTNDDILMFKMRLADQYRELEPEDKMSPSGTLSRDGADSNRTIVLSDIDGGNDVSSNKASRLATFQVKATPIHGSHTTNFDKSGGGGGIGSVAKIPEEVLSSCSRDLGGTDSGRGTSEDGSQGTSSFTDDSGYPTSPGHVTVRSGTAPRIQGTGGNYPKSYSGSAFDRPPLLMTFQGNNGGGSGSNSSGNDSPSSTITNSTTLPSRREFSYVVNKGEPTCDNDVVVHKTNPSNRLADNDTSGHETFLKQKINPGRLNMSAASNPPTPNKSTRDFDKSINSIKEQINAFLRPKEGNSNSNNVKPIVKETRLCSEPFTSTKLYSSNIKPSINSSFTPRGVQETGIPSASIYATQNGGNPSYNRNNKPLILGKGEGTANSHPLSSTADNQNSCISSPLYGTHPKDMGYNFNNSTNMTSTPSTSITNKLNSCPQLYKDSPSKVSLHSLSSQPSSASNTINKNKSRSFHNRESPLTLLPRSPLDLMNESLETQDDGNTTTTSGSYTIDHMDDLNLDLPSTDVYV